MKQGTGYTLTNLGLKTLISRHWERGVDNLQISTHRDILVDGEKVVLDGISTDSEGFLGPLLQTLTDGGQ